MTKMRRGYGFVRMTVAVIVVVLASSLAACGGAEDANKGANPTKSSVPNAKIPRQKLDPKIRAMLPKSVRDRGTIKTATGADYPPNEFLDSNQNLVGVHPDMARALGQIMGVKFDVSITTFDALIPGLKAGRYDIGLASASITRDRKKVVDFVNDIRGGDAVMVRTDDKTRYESRSDMCGHSVGVGKGTLEETRATEQAGRCKASGAKELTVQTFPDQQAAVQALGSRRVDLVLAPGLALAWVARQRPEAFKVVKAELYPMGDNGIMIRKNSGLDQAMLAAVNELIKNGTYGKILKKWGAERYARKQARLNPDTGK